MILSRGRRYLFIHIPKTGGTSLALALEGRAMKDDIMLGDTPKARNRRGRVKDVQARGRLWKHSRLADLDGLITAQEAAELFTFTLVRNPWDRVVSYYHWLRMQDFDHPAVGEAKAQDFAGFLRADHVRASLRASPAASYMRDASGVERCRAYIRLEHFQTDAAPLFDHLGFTLELPHRNASQRPAQYRDLYDARSRESVAELCAEDIARFSYRFEAG
ncbi:MAG: sulfotransferase family 2 domain-containing protein [Sulfitobacter sp.]